MSVDVVMKIAYISYCSSAFIYRGAAERANYSFPRIFRKFVVATDIAKCDLERFFWHGQK